MKHLVIPLFPTHIQLSKSRRAKYYNKESKIPKKLSKFGFDKKGRLVDDTGSPVIANPRTVGKQKLLKLSGNDIVMGFATHHIRAKIANELHAFFKPFVVKFKREHGTLPTPIKIRWQVMIPVGEANWDLSNLFFYWKYFEDSLVKAGVIPDDNIKFVTSAPGAEIVPVDDINQRAFIFTFTHDNRPELNREPWARSGPEVP